MNFRDALRKNLEADPQLSRRSQKLLAFLNEKPVGRLARVRYERKLIRMERHARAAADIKEGVIDWGTIDWKKVLLLIVETLLKLLPLIILDEMD